MQLGRLAWIAAALLIPYGSLRICNVMLLCDVAVWNDRISGREVPLSSEQTVTRVQSAKP